MSPEDDRFRGLSSESVSELVVSSSLMEDLVEDGVGGEVLGWASTDLARREWGELRPNGSRGLTAPAASRGGRNRFPRGEGSFSCKGRLWRSLPAGRPDLGARYSL